MHGWVVASSRGFDAAGNFLANIIWGIRSVDSVIPVTRQDFIDTTDGTDTNLRTNVGTKTSKASRCRTDRNKSTRKGAGRIDTNVFTCP